MGTMMSQMSWCNATAQLHSRAVPAHRVLSSHIRTPASRRLLGPSRLWPPQMEVSADHYHKPLHGEMPNDRQLGHLFRFLWVWHVIVRVSLHVVWILRWGEIPKSKEPG